MKSYEVEASFLGSDACRKLRDAGVRVPRAYHAELRPQAADPVLSSFCLVLEDFSEDEGWRQAGLLDGREIRSSLSTLARFHAHFWGGEELQYVWPSGCYFQPSMQPASQFTELGKEYRRHVSRFGTEFARELQDVTNVEGVGDRLARVAKAVASDAHPFDVEAGASAEKKAKASKFRTLIHGDPKTANVFLREGEAALIDMQWTGWGLPGTEIGHHIAASASPDALEEESALLDHYLAQLNEAGGRTLMTREELQSQYEVGLLDTARVAFGYQWQRASFDGVDEAKSLNRNAYNKNLKCAAWLVRRCDELLAED